MNENVTKSLPEKRCQGSVIRGLHKLQYRGIKLTYSGEQALNLCVLQHSTKICIYNLG